MDFKCTKLWETSHLFISGQSEESAIFPFPPAVFLSLFSFPFCSLMIYTCLVPRDDDTVHVFVCVSALSATINFGTPACVFHETLVIARVKKRAKVKS